MSAAYSFRYQNKDGYLHIQVTGRNTPETGRRYIRDILQASIQEECPNVLIEENLEGARMSLTDIFTLLSGLADEIRKAVRLAAFVDTNPERSESNQRFGETVAVNRGIAVKVFPTVAEAERWLAGKLTRRKKR